MTLEEHKQIVAGERAGRLLIGVDRPFARSFLQLRIVLRCKQRLGNPFSSIALRGIGTRGFHGKASPPAGEAQAHWAHREQPRPYVDLPDGSG